MTRPEGYRLVVLRHAEAEPPEFDVEDHDRALTARGLRDARSIGQRVVANGWAPARVIVSSARRTVQTWTLIADRVPAPIEPTVTRRLYLADLAALQGSLADQAPSDALWLIGHNPGLEELVRALTGQVAPMGTATAALLTRPDDIPWGQAVRAAGWHLDAHLRP